MDKRIEKTGEAFSRLCTKAVSLIMLAFMCYLLPMSFFRTTDMSTGGGIGEIVRFDYDNFFLNIIALFLCLCLCYLIWRLVQTLSLRHILIVLCLWVLLFGFGLVASARLQPSEDSYIVTFFARQAARGDLSYYHEYFRFFPYQFGFVLYEEVVLRLCYLVMPKAPEGFSSLILQGLNVIYTAAAYLALVMFTGRAFKSETVQKLTAALMFSCLPALFFVTFMYGNVPAFACVCGAFWAFAAFLEDGRWHQGLLTVVLMVLAVLLKLNSLIVVVAVLIVWLVSLVKKPGFRSAFLALLLLFSVLVCAGLPQKLYEKRSGEDFGSGIPKISWLAMGLYEGSSCSGWYNPTYTTTAYRLSQYDPEATADVARAAISDRLTEFSQNLIECERFFGRKFLSQWNEPSYQGLWNNQLREHYSQPGLMYELLCHRMERGVKAFMNIYQQLVFFGFTLGLFRILRKRDMIFALLPLTILGGMLYHLLFEAKSQHSQCYFVMMLPVAAYGLAKFYELIRETKSD